MMMASRSTLEDKARLLKGVKTFSKGVNEHQRAKIDWISGNKFQLGQRLTREKLLLKKEPHILRKGVKLKEDIIKQKEHERS